MQSALRQPWFRQMVTSLVIIGIWLGADGRIAHLVSCIQVVNLHPGESRAEVAPEVGCCAAPQVDSGGPSRLEFCDELDGCGCCSHEGSSHLSEADSRVSFKPEPHDLDGWLVTTARTIVRDEPFVPARAVPTTDRSLPAARILLLLGHLRF